MENKLKAAMLEGGPLHNGRAATASELIKFNRAWRRLLSQRSAKPAIFESELLALGLIYSAGKIRQGEAWEAEATNPRADKLKTAMLEGGPLHNGQAATIGQLIQFNRPWRRLLMIERASAQETLQTLGLIYSAGKIRQGEAWEAEPLPEKIKRCNPAITPEELLAKWDADQARKKALAKTKKRKPSKRKLGTPYRPRQKPEETEEQHAARLMGLIKNNPVTA